MEAMHERSHVNVQVDPRSNFTVMQDTSYIASISFTREKRVRLHTLKLRDSRNPPELIVTGNKEKGTT